MQLEIPGKWPTAEQLCRNARLALSADEEVFRIFYYDCEPFSRTLENPIDGSFIDYSLKPTYNSRKAFFADLGQMENVALRRGELRASGWELADNYKRNLIKGSPPVALTPNDV